MPPRRGLGCFGFANYKEAAPLELGKESALDSRFRPEYRPTTKLNKRKG